MTLQDLYSPVDFRKQGHQLVDLLADYLEKAQNRSDLKAIPYRSADDSLAYWQADFEAGVNPDPSHLFADVVAHSTHLHHPRYMGHQVGVVAPITALASMVSALLNNGMAVYEMGLVSNPLEKIVTDLLAKHIGYNNNSNGFLTSGGTLANLTALLAARAKYTEVWNEGSSEKLAVMVSEEAHYCIDRAARIMGLGQDGIIKIPVDERFKMRTELLEEYFQIAKNQGFKVIAIVGSACSTATGSYDDLRAIGAFAQKHQLWFHVDGAHGGAVVYSDKYKYLVEGIQLADSVVIDYHKMLMIPALATALIFRNGQDAYQTFHQKAQYLWANQTSEDWFNSGKRTFECTKYMMALKVYALIKTYGEGVFGQYIDYLHDLSRKFAEILNNHPDFELAHQPESNIVCFGVKDSSRNAEIRKKLLEKGDFYVVQTTIKDQPYLRVSLMNPLTTEHDLKDLMEEITKL